MKVVPIPNGVFAENCYLVVDEQAKQCAVVDPGEEAGLILHKIGETGSTLVGIWLTHAHLDHVVGVARVAEETGGGGGGVPVWLHPGDRALYDAVPQQAGAFGLAPPPELPAPNRDMVHGGQLTVGQLHFEIRHAPGHSPGSVCLIGHGVAFSGDVLFAGSIGRTDLPGGDFETLISSIERELLSLPDETIVYSGHGPETTIGRERRTNPFLTGVHRLG